MDTILDYFWNFTAPLSVAGLIVVLAGLAAVAWRWTVLAKDFESPSPSLGAMVRDPLLVLGALSIFAGIFLSALIFALRILLPGGP